MSHDLNSAPEVAEARDLAARTTQAISGFTIKTPAQYEDSAGILKRIKAGQKRLEELRTSITGPLNAALKAANDLFRGPGTELENAERQVKREMTRYGDEQEKLRREEQRKADEAAQKERDRLAEQQRLADADAARLRQEAEQQRLAGNEVEAAKLDRKADRKEDRASDLGATADTIVAPVVQRVPPKVSGVATREVWKFEITDPSKINPQFLMPDEKKIGAQVRALKGEATAIIGPGVRVYAERQIAAGAA